MSLLMAALMFAAKSAETPKKLYYAMGGLMSGHVELSLDLRSGEFSLSEASASTHGMLRAPQLLRIRQLAAATLHADLETRECKRRAASGDVSVALPIMDAMPSMTVWIGNRTVSAPANIGCWTKGAEKLASQALELAQSASK